MQSLGGAAVFVFSSHYILPTKLHQLSAITVVFFLRVSENDWFCCKNTWRSVLDIIDQ